LTRGYIIPIGGAEEKHHEPHVLRRFVKLCGGKHARIAILPTASELRETGQRYEGIFGEIGVKEARSLPFGERRDAERREWIDWLEQADGVFLTGGNQLRLSARLGGTRVHEVLKERNASGVHIAGTSAGAAILSEHMIAYGDEGASVRADMVTLAPGLGFTNLCIVDQHFRQRDRIGRLMSALAFNPFVVGLGLDEDTAAFIGPDDVLEVHGAGGVTVIDPSDVSHTTMEHVKRHEPVSILGLRVHVLAQGATFHLRTREARPSANVHGHPS
jgi:cyanophycinase